MNRSKQANGRRIVTSSKRMMLPTVVILVVWLCLVGLGRSEEQPQCSLPETSPLDPNLHEMVYDVGDGEQTTLVYIEPDVTTFYRDREAPAKTKVQPKFTGLSGKFINMSNKPVSLYWEDREGGNKHPQRHMNPFAATGTGTFPTHRFLFTELENPDNVLKTCVVGPYPENLYYYDPFVVEGDPDATEANLGTLTPSERELYDGWSKTLKFHEQYFAKTGRSYLANYLRSRPTHFMWPADYFGQEHWITTRETHVVQHPPKDLLEPILIRGKQRVIKADEPIELQDYRDPESPLLNLTLKVISVAPRALQIDNFLSRVEVEHIQYLASGIELHLSSTGQLEAGERQIKEKETSRTRTSYNSWVPREKSPIVDIIYRRAADLMRIDEALMRRRDADEFPNLSSKQSLAEQLQLVHYGLTQEYTAHHDFGYTNMADKEQGARYATLLLYLNEGMTGGETSFPRWVNAETFKELKVTPKVGKAVLFYSQLPDGNLDDFSEHAALPVTDGEKVRRVCARERLVNTLFKILV